MVRHDVSKTQITSLGAVSGDMHASPIENFGFSPVSTSQNAAPTVQSAPSTPLTL